MKVDKETIRRLAALAGLTVDASEIDEIAQEIHHILLFAEKLPAVTGDDSAQETREQSIANHIPDGTAATVFPADSSFTKSRLDANGFIRVPRVFDMDSSDDGNTE